MISFSDDSNALRSCEKLKRKISFTESQSFEIVPIAQSNSTTIVLPLAAIIVFIVISGYLLIYNILYISISRDTQFYGQLKTIGTTKRQIKRIVRSQIFRTAVIGIPSGLIVGGIVSLGLVPFAMNMMYSSDTDLGEIVSFSPIILRVPQSSHFYCNHRQHETSENSCKYFSCCGFTLYGGKYKELPRS